MRNWKTDTRFSGSGAVTTTEWKPKETAPARHRPSAADLPLPLGAVRDTVVDLPLSAPASGESSLFFLSRSAHASRNVSTALAWSSVFVSSTSLPTCGVSLSVSLSRPSCLSSSLSNDSTSPSLLPSPSPISSSRPIVLFDSGRMLSSSSQTRQLPHRPRLKMNRSLNRGTTSPDPSVRYRECTSMDIWYSCRRLLTVLIRNTTSPPPWTVSMVRAMMLGVSASKSCRTSIECVVPSTRCESL